MAAKVKVEERSGPVARIDNRNPVYDDYNSTYKL